MKLKYGYKETYQHQMSKEQLDFLTSKTNRSTGQTLFLYQLVDGDFERLIKLEEQIKNCFIHYCPGDKESVEDIMGLTPRDNFKI